MQPARGSRTACRQTRRSYCSLNLLYYWEVKLLLVIFVALATSEFGIWLRPFWRLRKPLSVFFVAAELAVSLALLAVYPRAWTALILFFGLYRGFNLSRIIQGRMHEAYLRQATLKSAAVLYMAQLAVVAIMAVSNPSRWYVLSGLQLALGLVIYASTLHHVRTTREPSLSRSYTDRDLPTLSVAIPARNETEELERCLQSLVANDYPKLEILVLDDCSSNAKTPEIIRQYAHDGVRFIAGSEPDATWLAKNWGYEHLSEVANGEMLLFCGVDTRFAPGSLRTLVATLLETRKNMLSVLPHNARSELMSQLVQPVRYGWELGLPRRLFQRPPVLSTCWLIRKSLLKSAGGFRAVSRSIVPESYFARVSSVHEGYGFIRTNAVTSIKNFADQRDTAVRTRYPQLHRRPELVAFLSLAELSGMLLPLGLLVLAFMRQEWLPALVSALAYVLFTAAWIIIGSMTYGRFTPFSIVSFPLAVLFDVYLMHYSMVQYEFSEVVWKGRNVCIPVMHVVPHMPPLAYRGSHGNAR